MRNVKKIYINRKRKKNCTPVSVSFFKWVLQHHSNLNGGKLIDQSNDL